MIDNKIFCVIIGMNDKGDAKNKKTAQYSIGARKEFFHMKLQYAMDTFSMEEALDKVNCLLGVVDVFEIGTPMLLRYGLEAVRTLRADMGVHPAKRTSLIIETADKTPFEDGAAYLAKFAFANEVSFTEKYTGDTKGVAQVVTHAARAFIPMMELIDREKEQARLAKEKAQCEKEIASMAAKLSNEGFVNKAPAHIVEDMRQKHAAAAEKLAKIEESIRNLG